MALRSFFALILLLAAPLLWPDRVRAQPATSSAWVQLTGAGAELRVVAEGPCPQAMVDGRARPMSLRAPPSADFPAVCSLVLPDTAASVSVDGRALPTPRPAQRIVVMGDTGCRVKDLAVQACNNSRAWPFATVARLAAAQKPDLVIHVGDYYYRETPCPPAVSACAGSPYGDRWGTWAAEFFDPAQPLLAAAPWVFARGNHESCNRGGKGWYALLDAGPAPAACAPLTPSLVVRSGDLNLMVIDSADASDRDHKPDEVAAVTAELNGLGPALEQGKGWIITHRPIWGLVPVLRLGPAAPLEVGLNFTQQAAVHGRALAGVQMVLSGHVHHFQAIDFGAARPAQLIVGTGGDVGETADLARAYGGMRDLDGLDATSFTFSRFGYYVMDKDGDDWTGAFHDIDDKIRATCRLHGRELTCKAAP